MKGGLGNLMKQAQQMQENLQKAQEQLAQEELTQAIYKNAFGAGINFSYKKASSILFK